MVTGEDVRLRFAPARSRRISQCRVREPEYTRAELETLANLSANPDRAYKNDGLRQLLALVENIAVFEVGKTIFSSSYTRSVDDQGWRRKSMKQRKSDCYLV